MPAHNSFTLLTYGDRDYFQKSKKSNNTNLQGA